MGWRMAIKKLWYLERKAGRCESLASCFVRADTWEEAIEIAKTRVIVSELKFWDDPNGITIFPVMYEGDGDFLLGFPIDTMKVGEMLVQAIYKVEVLNPLVPGWLDGKSSDEKLLLMKEIYDSLAEDG